MNNVLDAIYNEFLRRLQASSIYSTTDKTKIRPSNIAEYSEVDKNKRLLSIADYPALQFIWGDFTPTGASSNGDDYSVTISIECPTGSMVYTKGYNDIALGLIELCNSFKGWNKTIGTGTIYGASVSAISPVKYDPRNGEGQIECWACSVSIDFRVKFQRNAKLWAMNLD